MADFMKVKVSGNAFAALDKLASPETAESVLRSAGVAGARVFQAEAIENTNKFKKQTGVIKKNIIIKRVTEESDSGAQKQSYIVTVRKGPYEGGDAFYAPFVEKGHEFNGFRKKTDSMTWKAYRAAMKTEFGTSRVPAVPFMRPAYESMKEQAKQAIRKRAVERLNEIMGGKL